VLTDTITLVQGDSEVQMVTLTDQTSALINDPTANYELCVKSSYTDADPGIFLKSVEQTTAGTAFITVQPNDTASLTPPAVLLYQIVAKETSGRVTTIALGKFVVLPAVLKAP
jgi:hypothetical protein